jgi:sodium transport system permease protein
MNWRNIKLIFLREVRDQLRDRRTLFMIAVLPILLYPLLGMSILQVAQFLREQPTDVLIVGAPDLPELPPLVVDNQFDPQWLSDPNQKHLFKLHFSRGELSGTGPEVASIEEQAKQTIHQGKYQAVVVFPDDFSKQMENFRNQLKQHGEKTGEGEKTSATIPNPVIYCNTANEKSQLAYTRVAGVLRSWADAIGKQNLKDSQLPADTARPFEFQREDVSEAQQRSAAMWSKILPFVLLLWALTGAFYPAIDLCAGEKERGTLETLLCSPAQRSEIVTGKLLTVMLFSIATSLLNLASMGLTGAMVIAHLPLPDAGARLGMPPLLAQLWLVLALLPVAALFSALCIALAAFARSTKEGQYYLMPLLLVTLPLVILPMGPGMELNLGNSLIPLTGLVLLLKGLLEGNYMATLPYAAPVVAITLLLCLIAVRWAVDQFNKESVLFRESERLDVGLWFKHLVRDRGDTPSVTEAIFCGVLILLIRFAMSLSLHPTDTFADFARLVIVSQLVLFVTPTLLMTVMLTRSPRKTLLFKMPAWWTLPAAVLLAVSLSPVAKALQVVVGQLYPVSAGIKEEQAKIGTALADAPSLWIIVALIALLPAICEELTFRGFILSGFRHLGHKWWAIVASSLLFGVAHPLLQQSLVTCVVGLVIAFIAVQTGSILPGMLFHFTHNALLLVVAHYHDNPAARPFTEPLAGGDFIYAWWVFGLGAIVAAILLLRFATLSYQKTDEEVLQEALEHQSAVANV